MSFLVCCFLFVVRCPLVAVCCFCVLHVVCYLMSVAGCLGGCSLFVVCCLLCAGWRLLCVVSCLLRICCWLCAAWSMLLVGFTCVLSLVCFVLLVMCCLVCVGRCAMCVGVLCDVCRVLCWFIRCALFVVVRNCL